MVAWFVKKSRRPYQNLVQIRISAALSAGGDFFYWADEYFSLQIFTNIADLILHAL
jgi:hypothetical protein